jgi:hypothetical protein
VVLGEVFEQDCRLLDERRVGLGAAERCEGGVQRGFREGDARERRDACAVGGEQVGGEVDVVLGGRLPARRHGGRLLGEPVERLAVLVDEALGELEVLRTPLARGVGESRAERAHVVIVEAVAGTQVGGDLLDELVGDVLGAHVSSCT